MPLKSFNLNYGQLANNGPAFSTEDEAHLHCLLKETMVNGLNAEKFDDVHEVIITIRNLHQIVQKCDNKSGPFGKAIELIEQIIESLADKQNVMKTIPILPMLTDVLLKNSSRIDQTLKMIQISSFGVVVKPRQPFLERLIEFCVKILRDEKNEQDRNLKTTALSVLINLCSRNSISLEILEEQINFVDFQKIIPRDDYGILTYTMNLILDERSHILCEVDVLNYLKYTSKELHRILSLDEMSLKHLVEFLRDLFHLNHSKQVFQMFDFSAAIQAALMNLENATDTHIDAHINSLFEIIKIIMTAKNMSLKNLIISIIHFGIKRLKSPEHCIQALVTLATVFNHDPKISIKNFELEELQDMLKIILNNKRQSSYMAPLFKLLNVLAKNYKVNLLKQPIIDSIFAPLVKGVKMNATIYFKLSIGDITMYLECLSTLSTLLDIESSGIKGNLFKESSIQFMVAMSIKHGSAEQCCLALSLLNRFCNQKISEIIASNYKNDEPQVSQQVISDSSNGLNLSKELGKDRIRKVFFEIEKACLKDKIDCPASNFIELYSNENAMLKQEIALLTKKYEDIAEELNMIKAHKAQLELTSMKWSEIAQNIQKSSEYLVSDNEKLKVIQTTLRSQVKATASEHDEALRKLSTEKTVASKKNKEMEEKLQALEDELKDTEDMRLTIMSLMSKRKKTSKES